MKIYRYDDKTKDNEITDISAEFVEGGSLVIRGYDMGPIVEELLGDYDHEYWMTIAAEDIRRFVLLVLRKTFNTDTKLTFGNLLNLCKENGIDAHAGGWT